MPAAPAKARVTPIVVNSGTSPSGGGGQSPSQSGGGGRPPKPQGYVIALHVLQSLWKTGE